MDSAPPNDGPPPLAHHSEPGDPVLFEWIKHQLDALLGLEPAVIVVGLGLVILAIPVGITLIYFAQRLRQRRP